MEVSSVSVVVAPVSVVEYGIKVWEAIGPDGALSIAEIIVPDHGELARLWNKTGTAVILHGDGSMSTWSQTMADRVHRYLAEPYFIFPNDVRVQTRGSKDPGRRLVVPYGHLLASHNIARGVVEFSDVKSLSGQIH